jgi:hypothetical protein
VAGKLIPRFLPRRGSSAVIGASLCWLLSLGCAAPRVQEEASPAGEWVSLFDGESLAGWEGGNGLFRVEDGAIVGGTTSAPIARNEFLCTTKEFSDFELQLRFRLSLGGVNSGVQIRSKRIPGSHEVIGYQADLGDGWWGALYDESRRARLLAEPDSSTIARALDRDGWNAYRIHAEGGRIRLFINDSPTIAYTEPEPGIEQRGTICLQIHGGPPGEAWFRDIQIREIPDGQASGVAPAPDLTESPKSSSGAAGR